MDEELYLLGSDGMLYSTMMIVEGSENKRPGVLCEVEGPFMVIEKDNNNDRYYTESLIDNKILGTPYTKKMLANKTLYGEASHPSDRFDVKLPLISHNISDLWWNNDKTILMGRADVLDTPSGRIIYTLVQYGSKIGISVRARGRLINKGGKKIPDEEVYQFKTFDFVPNPGFDEARLNRVDESEDDLETTFMKYVNEASVSELSCIQSIFESANDEMFGNVKKVIKDRLAENTLPQNNADLNDQSVTNILYEETVLKDERILELEELLEEARASVQRLEGERDVLNEEVLTLQNNVEQKTKDIDNITLRLISLSESEESYSKQNNKLVERVEKLTKNLKQYRSDFVEATQRLEESEQLAESLKTENLSILQQLDEAYDDLDSYQESMKQVEVKTEVVEATRKKKILPQGKSQVLNESVVDSPIATADIVDYESGRRKNFIMKCSI